MRLLLLQILEIWKISDFPDFADSFTSKSGKSYDFTKNLDPQACRKIGLAKAIFRHACGSRFWENRKIFPKSPVGTGLLVTKTGQNDQFWPDFAR